jgi:hypothetical protein
MAIREQKHPRISIATERVFGGSGRVLEARKITGKATTNY